MLCHRKPCLIFNQTRSSCPSPPAAPSSGEQGYPSPIQALVLCLPHGLKGGCRGWGSGPGQGAETVLRGSQLGLASAPRAQALCQPLAPAASRAGPWHWSSPSDRYWGGSQLLGAFLHVGTEPPATTWGNDSARDKQPPPHGRTARPGAPPGSVAPPTPHSRAERRAGHRQGTHRCWQRQTKGATRRRVDACWCLSAHCCA